MGITLRSPKWEPVEIDYGAMNKSELAQLAESCEIRGASRALPRRVLIWALVNLEHIEVEGATLALRLRICKWLKRHWSKCQMQLSDVAWEKPEDCLRDSDVRVAKFWMENDDQI